MILKPFITILFALRDNISYFLCPSNMGYPSPMSEIDFSILIFPSLYLPGFTKITSPFWAISIAFFIDFIASFFPTTIVFAGNICATISKKKTYTNFILIMYINEI